jgi:starch-binding outer membrane protein, SusD/RagB family
MIMKAIFKAYKFPKILALLTILSFGCSESFLDYEQRGVQTASSFYQTDEQSLEALMAVFDRWQQGTCWNYLYLHMALSDECYAGGGSRGDNGGQLEELNEYRFSPATPPINSHYSWLYYCVHRSNILIDNVAPDTENKALHVAMAKALRGYAYFFLVNLWGDVPLVLHELSSAEYNQPRTPKVEVYAQIEKDLTEAIDVLPVRSEMPADYQHLVTKGTAQSILGKVYLFEEKFDEAAEVFQEIIDSDEYDLYPDYTKLLRVESEYGVESVWEIPFVSTMNYGSIFGAESGMGGWQIMLSPRPEYLPYPVYGALDLFVFGWGFINPHKELYDAFTEAGDLVRRNASIIGPDSLQQLGGEYKTMAGFTPYGSDGYIRLKYLPYLSEGAGDNDWVKFSNITTNCRMIRYADVLLMAAEANNRKSAPDDVKAQSFVNEVRGRVNLDPVETTGDALFEDIKLERKFELAFEGERYLDLQRWGDAYDALKDQGKSIPDGAGDFLHPDGAGYDQNKNELLPIPEYEMTVNTAMAGQQNPGY